jgi:rubrerythrin
MSIPVAAAEDESAAKNLVAAFEDELNAHVAYKAYAVRADAEGLPGAASLFRATARAEQIHANNHGRAIRQMGCEATAEMHEILIETTKENLKRALTDQRFKSNSLYPSFLTDAVSLFDATAIRSFRWALEADKTHARLYDEAVSQMDASEKPEWACASHDFYVCALCGYTSDAAEADNCPACSFLGAKFEVVH